MRVAVVQAQTPYVSGGAEGLARALTLAIAEAGHEVELVELPSWIGGTLNQLGRAMGSSLSMDLAASSHQPIDRVIALKFPAWLVRHPNKVIWVLHQFRQAYDLWEGGLEPVADGRLSRDLTRQADHTAFGEARSVKAISRTVANRLRQGSGFEAPVLRPPPPDDTSYYSSGLWEPYFFFPSRITPLKRHDLVLEALAKTKEPVKLVLAGSEERPGAAETLLGRARALGVSDRVECLGWCSPERLRELYSRARAVVFPPFDEDFGFITAEAMLSARPVVTCLDSGGPQELVSDQRNGLVVAPRPEALASAMDLLWEDAGLARSWGEQGRIDYRGTNPVWSEVVEELLA